MTGATTGRMAQTSDPFYGMERKAFVPNKDTVYVLDRQLSMLLLDYDPGEGNEVHLPYDSPNTKEN